MINSNNDYVSVIPLAYKSVLLYSLVNTDISPENSTCSIKVEFLITKITSAITTANSISCVINIRVNASFLCKSTISSMIFLRKGRSKPFVASSKIRHLGSAANALAIATRSIQQANYINPSDHDTFFCVLLCLNEKNTKEVLRLIYPRTF